MIGLLAFALAGAAPAIAGARSEVVWVEQARIALLHDRPDLARQYSMRALAEEPEAWAAWRLYLRASAEAGLRDVAEAELAALDDPAAAVALQWWKVSTRRASVDSLRDLEGQRAQVAYGWSVLARGRETEVLELDLPSTPLAMKLRLRALAMSGQGRSLDREARAYFTAHPEAPDVLGELWGRDVPTTRAQKVVLAGLQRRVAAGESDAAWLSLAARTLVAAGDRETTAVVTERIAAQGLLPPLNRKPWGSSMRKAMAKALVAQDPALLPDGSLAERIGIAEHLGDAWLVRDRADDAVAMWESLLGDVDRWRVWRGLARALEATGANEDAAAARLHAVDEVLGSWPSDPCGLDVAGRAAAASQLLADDPTVDLAGIGEALSGDVGRWRKRLGAAEEERELSFCLAAAAGEDDAVGWVGPRPEVAAPVIRALHEAAREQVPETLRATVSRAGIPATGDAFPDLVLPLETGATTLRRFVAREAGLTVVSLWATWCGPCQKEMPQVDALVGALRTEGLGIDAIALSVDDDERAYRRHLQRKPLEHLAVGRAPGALAAVGGASLPVTWVLDDEGIVVLAHVGYDPDLPARIEAAVRQRGQ